MKRFLSVVLVLLLGISMSACGSKEVDSEDKIYYVSTDKTSVIGVPYAFESITISSKIREALDMLSTEVAEVDYMMTIPKGVSVDEWDINNGNLALYFTEEYLDLDTCTEVLVRAAIVKTLVQIEGVDSVSFYVDNSPLTDSEGNVVGAMAADSFIDDFGEETDSLLSCELTLYFASADGMSIQAETREVYYSRNVAVEKLVVEQLMKGPDSEDLLSTIPSDTKLVSVSVTDGICYVNFDGGFETVLTGITENATVYSIVNSLCKLDSVKQVQLLVNGEIPHLSNLDVDLNNPLEPNEDIINVPSEDSSSDEVIYDENGDVVVEEDIEEDSSAEEADSETEEDQTNAE